ncbi:transporter substrate-binding domain-containing protein [Undibacterium sp. Jales W-56]|uniref:substrate-binding periplasmic protein n=1 Tax=Undibacterium sp. Jales W-56 TaxID=2897325 RepID=UPI0021D321C9|nr:transporter substrate-binding domain-containing protein [Undibacterium sp. Jales W-56]MCU6433968.1 transporter substrate-binding domain-containing protein [Undibacterium sp. Jales W-56]
MRHRLYRKVFLAIALLTGLVSYRLASAGCSRVMQVPVAPVGQSVTIDGNAVGGIYPDLLRELKDECTFAFMPVPWARLEKMFETGSADLLIPASRTSRRDEIGIFVPMILVRATLISIASERPGVKSAQELIERHDIKVAVVRGYDYGPAYSTLLKELNRQGRLTMEADPLSVARILKAGVADVTIMAPSVLAGVIQNNDKVRDMLDKLRFEPISELPWIESGVYISKSSVSTEDKTALKESLERAAKSGVVWKAFQRHYSANLLKEGARPR